MKKYNFWYLLRQRHLETVCEKTFWTSKHCPAESSSHFQHRGSDGMKFFKFDLTRTTGGEALFLSVGNTQFLELILNLESLQQFLEEQLLDQLLKFESWKILEGYGFELQFHQLSIPERHLTLGSPEKQSVLWMKSMTTKRSSDPVRNCSQPFRNQKGKNLVWKKEDPIAPRNLMLLKATRKLVRTLSAVFSMILCYSYGWKENGSLLMPTLHEEDICLHRYPRWSQRWHAITIKTNENKTDHIIGTPWDRCCWRRLHRMEQDNFLTINGFIWFMKGAVRKESNTPWITTIPCVTFEQFKDTLVIFR